MVEAAAKEGRTLAVAAALVLLPILHELSKKIHLTAIPQCRFTGIHLHLLEMDVMAYDLTAIQPYRFTGIQFYFNGRRDGILSSAFLTSRDTT